MPLVPKIAPGGRAGIHLRRHRGRRGLGTRRAEAEVKRSTSRNLRTRSIGEATAVFSSNLEERCRLASTPRWLQRLQRREQRLGHTSSAPALSRIFWARPCALGASCTLPVSVFCVVGVCSPGSPGARVPPVVPARRSTTLTCHVTVNIYRLWVIFRGLPPKASTEVGARSRRSSRT